METVPIPVILQNGSDSLLVTTQSLALNREKELTYKTYEFYMKKGYGDPNIPWQPLVNLSAGVRVHLITGLEPNRTYAFRVRGRSESGVYSSYSLTTRTNTLPLGQFARLCIICIITNRPADFIVLL